jgi:outer membrane receptor for ferrienterochelin and colicins
MRWWDPFDKQIDDKLTNPNGYTFDTGYSYAPMQGRRLIIGARFLIK